VVAGLPPIGLADPVAAVVLHGIAAARAAAAVIGARLRLTRIERMLVRALVQAVIVAGVAVAVVVAGVGVRVGGHLRGRQRVRLRAAGGAQVVAGQSARALVHHGAHAATEVGQAKLIGGLAARVVGGADGSEQAGVAGAALERAIAQVP